MKVSYKWLQTFFENPLPSPEEVKVLFERHLAEIENMEKVGDDTMIDVNILPDRACYCLNHEAIAFELYQLLSDNTFKPKKLKYDFESVTPLESRVEDTTLCDRQIFIKIEGIDNTVETPEEIREMLEAAGQRSISFIVDLTNFAMLNVGQPLHAFDADKVSGMISVRKARPGEKVTTLDNKEIAIEEGMIVIADEEAPLDIAGIKGGKKAETTKETKNIYLSASHFDGTSIRKTSQKVGIKTDASKRFENRLSSADAKRGATDFLLTLLTYQPDAKVAGYIDLDFAKREDKELEVSAAFISEKIGINEPADTYRNILEKMHLKVDVDGDRLKLQVPEYRKDLNIPEDIADEIGRIIGYDKTPSLISKFTSEGRTDNIFIIGNQIRNFLNEKGFSEVYTYSLANTGEIEIQNPLASDKSFMRANLTDGIKEALAKNVYFADLLGLSKIQIFEIGKVFKKDREFNALAIGIAYKKAAKGQSAAEDIKAARDDLFSLLSPELKTVCSVDDTGGLLMIGKSRIGSINNFEGILELDLDAIISEMKDVSFEPLKYRNIGAKYSRVSEFPFTSRDVAVFVPGPKGKENEVLELIQKEGGELLVRTDLFDVFEKKDKETGEIEKTSYAFRLVFQSFEKTLTDGEVDPIMEKVYSALKARDWEVR